MEIKSLSSIALFDGFSPEEQRFLSARLQYFNLRRGQALFTQGDSLTQVFFILGGKAKITRSSADGRENLLIVLGPGDVAGILSTINSDPSSVSCVAVSKLSVASLSHRDFERLGRSSSQLSKSMFKELSWRLIRSNQMIADLTFSDVPGRLAGALIDLADRFGVQTADGFRVCHDLTQEELSQMVGSSRETVNKILSEFVDRGWVKLEVRSVTLLDYERLTKRST